ncbi:MAG: phosphate signaling complex protein PhoU [Acidobacteriota bacterium]|nr:MAG: phosphate signaling complex protein PhoU [Acidobacteriota bacterium]
MERHFEHDLETLSARLQQLGGMVEEAIGRSIEALVNRDAELARSVIRDDERVDQLELTIDQLAMQIFARYQLAARDLRFVATAIKITPDLERIGDHAVNVCERALELLEEPPLKPLIDLPLMARRAQEMLRRALDAFVNHDADEARAVIMMDDELDQRMESIFRELLSYMMDDHRTISRALRLTFLAKYFERIGDQATNIAEMIVYMVEGRVIKHPRLSTDA